MAADDTDQSIVHVSDTTYRFFDAVGLKKPDGSLAISNQSVSEGGLIPIHPDSSYLPYIKRSIDNLVDHGTVDQLDHMQIAALPAIILALEGAIAEEDLHAAEQDVFDDTGTPYIGTAIRLDDQKFDLRILQSPHRTLAAVDAWGRVLYSL